MGKWLASLKTIGQLPKRYLGVMVGVLLWIFIEIFGFLPTLLLCVFTVIGYTLGRVFEDRDKWQEIVEKIWQSDPYDR